MSNAPALDPLEIPPFLLLTPEERRASYTTPAVPNAPHGTTTPCHEPTRLETWTARGDFSPKDLAFIASYEAATRAKQEKDKAEGLAQLAAWKAAQPPTRRRKKAKA